MSINDTRLAHAKPNTPEYALVTYQRSLLYRRLGNREEEKRYLALSALTDIRLSITDHASLWNLAELLYEEGDMSMPTVTSVSRGTKPTDTTPVAAASRLRHPFTDRPHLSGHAREAE
mgnify:CR=1 FL=1